MVDPSDSSPPGWNKRSWTKVWCPLLLFQLGKQWWSYSWRQRHDQMTVAAIPSPPGPRTLQLWSEAWFSWRSFYTMLSLLKHIFPQTSWQIPVILSGRCTIEEHWHRELEKIKWWERKGEKPLFQALRQSSLRLGRILLRWPPRSGWRDTRPELPSCARLSFNQSLNLLKKPWMFPGVLPHVNPCEGNLCENWR